MNYECSSTAENDGKSGESSFSEPGRGEAAAEHLLGTVDLKSDPFRLASIDTLTFRPACEADRPSTSTQEAPQVREPTGYRAARRSRRDVPGQCRRQTLLHDNPKSLGEFDSRTRTSGQE